MNQYKHYSFDLWLTLIRSNPQFKKERSHYFHKNYNRRNKPLEEVELCFRRVDLMCDAINQKTGGNIDAEEMYLMVICMLNEYDTSFEDIDMEAVYNEMEKLLFCYLPQIYCPSTQKVLKELKDLSSASFSILSNTGFIKGETLRKVLRKIKLEPFFEFQHYSDELGMSKPNKQFFIEMMRSVTELKQKPILPEEVLHIGDNPRADIVGAQSVGLNTLLINSNQISISTLLS